MSRGEGHRSLADQLRAWPEERLARLLILRPDLATPVPRDSGQLASRAATRASLVRALDQLTRAELVVLDALVIAHQTTRRDLLHLIRADETGITAALDRLCDLALAWESTGGLRALTGIPALLTGGPEGGVSGVRPLAEDAEGPGAVSARLEALSPAARALLSHVDRQGGEATSGTARLDVTPEEADHPAEELIARRLLVPHGRVLAVPGEVALALRGGTTTRDRSDIPPAVSTSDRPARLVDQGAAGAAFEAVRRTELLLDGWGTSPPVALRSGGLAVRDLKAAAGRLQVDEPTAALLAEVAYAAGLVATSADQDGNPAWMPTDAFDGWVAVDPADRWLTLVDAWLAMHRAPGLVGSRDAAGKTWNALVPELTSVHIADTRRMTLDVLTGLRPGEALAAGTGAPSLVSRLSWLRPRRPRSRADHAVWTLTEAETLGVTGLGGPSSYSRAWLAGEDPRPLLADLLPEPVDHLLLQADLTGVAPGPLDPALARRLQEMADVESRGGATVYRFTPSSVRRALDAGWTATEIHTFLGSVSRTPVPQPLDYLVDDTARTFGRIRVGHAEAFLRAEDETTLTELLNHPRAGSLGLRRIAPTVLVSSTPIDLLLPRLRDLGAAPVVEAADGTVHVARPDALRARTPQAPRPTGLDTARSAARVSAVVAAVRAGDRTRAETAAQTPSPLPQPPSDAVAVLREAIDAGAPVLIEYVDDRGVRTDRVVDPVAVDSGRLTAHDHRAEAVRRFAVHRITTVRPAPSAPAE
ncbi:helicase C-terminal domain-containing protein [Nocardioides insulae]|uniref:helicase C-terminal domain-containing protein n=1 Tax=Nocardioides insulae TaxID=394734 RepID=UPI000425A2A2|nr:helicase C-terminal domain-containing protein [Nocardioides insulae]